MSVCTIRVWCPSNENVCGLMLMWAIDASLVGDAACAPCDVDGER